MFGQLVSPEGSIRLLATAPSMRWQNAPPDKEELADLALVDGRDELFVCVCV